jgi:hypothetical protein
VKNILATASCSIETRGRVVELVEPELIIDPELRTAPPREYGLGGGEGYVVMRCATSYFVTDVRRPGVSAAGIALSASSPRW